jgi:hypothetical protein
MAETQRRMSSKDVGNVTVSYLNQQPDLGASDAQDASLKINLDEFSNQLDLLNGKKTLPGGECGMGKLLKELPESVSEKLKQALLNENIEATGICALLRTYGYIVSSNIMRRHRRTMMGKDGCKCEQ